MRRAALDAVEGALRAADPGQATRRYVQRHGELLNVGNETIDLDATGRIYVLGAGKASYPIAAVLEDLLCDRLTGGIVVCKHGQPGHLDKITLRQAAHPIPDAAGEQAAGEVAALARQTKADDLIICAITGGSSALLPLPIDGIALKDKQDVTRLLLASGADIFEINAVRKHLSTIKGGRLAKMLHPEARLINLTVSDVVGDALDYITDPSVPDTSTLADARATFDRYGLWKAAPSTVRQALADGGTAEETPKDLRPLTYSSHILVDTQQAPRAALARLAEQGYAGKLLDDPVTGESIAAGQSFAALATSVLTQNLPVAPPCALVGSGETTVTLATGAIGHGGPNQEFALAAALALPDNADVLVLGLDTDGSDGPTDLAGGLADNTTLQRAYAAELELRAGLEHHNSSAILTALNDGIITGATGTNVNDLKVLLVGRPG